MKLIQHRINTVQQLNALSPRVNGCEIDLRSHSSNPGKLHLSHDPWVEGVDFEMWLKAYKHKNFSGPLILNTKEDGLEDRALELLAHYQITQFFFLDTALPTLVRWTKQKNEKRFAIRLSDYEPKELAEKFQGLADWIWVDCFDTKPIDAGLLPKHDFKICLVSPELQGGNVDQISNFKLLAQQSHAVCTKYPDKW